MNQMQASYVPSIKLYYSAFPLVSSSYVQNTILACIRAFSGMGKDYSICRLDDAVERGGLPKPNYSESLDYSSLYTRYAMENRFLRLVEAGDTENVLMAYRSMALQSVSSNRYINAVYQDPVSSLSIVRALVRKAAENGGASIMEINEITQRAVQRAVACNRDEGQAEITETMILELTNAVKQKKLRLNRYTPPIQRVIEYLHLNYSQKISLSKLAKLAALSDAYLSRDFKAEVGMTITQYIAHLRCEQAAQLLRDSDTPIQDISSFVGYTDNNYFVKVFKKMYGATPSGYRSGRGP